MGTVCIGGTKVIQAVLYNRTQLWNNADGDGTHDVSVEDDLVNGMCGAGYQEINPVLEVIIEI